MCYRFRRGIRPIFVEKELRNLDKGTVIQYYFSGQKPTKSWRDSLQMNAEGVR